MSKDNSREERLAAQLRANLKRRKVQKKAMATQPGPASRDDSPGPAQSDLSKPDLSKTADEG